MSGDKGGMRNHVLLVAALSLAASSVAAPAAAADRNFGVSGFDRIRLDGDYRVTLTTGVAPFAKASGDSRAIDNLSLRVEGRTLVVRSSQSGGWGSYPGAQRGAVTISIGTHELSAAYVNGAGSLDINRVEGLKFDASAMGAGALNIGEVAVDQLNVALAGAASTRLAGTVGKLTLIVRGASTVDSDGLGAKDAVIGAEGPAVIRLTVTETAKVNASGVGMVSLSGEPACTVTVRGSASVTGCKEQRR